jgi:shikimate dehydrogenase
VAGADCLVLGAGGSARAVVYGLARAGARLFVAARRLEQAEALAAQFAEAAIHPCPLSAVPEIAHSRRLALVVNATPLGMGRDAALSPWPDELSFPPGAWAYDLVYAPAETRFMRQALASGARAANGLGMLLQQAGLAFELWTGRRPDLAVMAAALPGGLAD